MGGGNGTVFFSYSRDEYVMYVLKVKEYLEKEGFEVFFDKEQLQLGKEWALKLEVGIAEKEKFIFFITPHSCRHDGFCRKEISMAMYCQKEILPVMIKEEKPPLLICDLQYLDMLFLSEKKEADEQLFKERMQELVGALRGEVKFSFKEEQKKVYEKLEPIDFTQDFARHKRFIGREWVKEEVDKWINKYKNSRVLWITADAGYGKSAIACHLSDVHPDVIGIHFCSYNYPSKNSARNVIKTLAYHFQTQIDGYADEIVNVDKSEGNLFELFEALILNPLKRLQPKKDRNYIVIIDALDEAFFAGEGELIELISSEFSQLPEYVKIIITSRPEPKLKQTLSKLKPLELKADYKQNIEDCKEFIEVKLLELGFTKYVEDREFFETLIEKSEANMLYLTLFFDGVKNDLIDIDKPDIFPIGLNGIYENFFSRITEDEDEYDEVFAPLLEVIAVYNKPIIIDNIVVHIELIEQRLLADILGISFIKIGRILTKLGSMIRITNNKYIDFYHKSLSDWLFFNENCAYQIDEVKGHKKIYKYVKRLNLENITPKLLGNFSKAVILLNKQNIKYKYYFDDMFSKICNENMSNSIPRFLPKAFLFNKKNSLIIDNLTKIKYLYYLSEENFDTVIQYCKAGWATVIDMSLSNKDDRLQIIWNRYNPISLVLLLDDSKLYKYIKYNNIFPGYLSLAEYSYQYLYGDGFVDVILTDITYTFKNKLDEIK